MATTTGQNGVIKIDVSGTNTIVGEVRSFSMEESADSIETSVMGNVNNARTYVAGLESSTITVDAYFDASDAAQNNMTGRQAVDFELYPSGTDAGNRVFSGDGFITSRSVSTSFDGMVEVSFTIQVSGVVTGAIV